MMFNIYELGSGVDIVENYNELKVQPEFQLEIKDKNKIVRYILFFYDKGSPYETRYKDYNERKAACAEAAGFKYNTKWPKSIEDVMNGENKEANLMIAAFLKMHLDTDWSHLVAMKTIYYKQIAKVLDGSISSANYSNLDKLKESIDKTSLKMSKGDKKVEKAIFKVMNYQELNLRPENFISS